MYDLGMMFITCHWIGADFSLLRAAYDLGMMFVARHST